MGRLLRLWFGLSDRVDARTYLWSGLVLMALKYAVDASVIGVVTGKFWTPFAYLMPAMTIRDSVAQLPAWLDVVMAVWTLPFLWIGVSMTVRRAVDAGWSAWAGLLFFVPFLNYLIMVWLAVAPERESSWTEGETREVDPDLTDSLRAVAASVVAGAPLVALLTLLWERTYGFSLFLGVPFVVGTIAGWTVNRRARRSLRHTLLVVLIGQGLIGGAMILFALEGAVCVAMALPATLLPGFMGGVIGREIASRCASPLAHAGFVLLALPGVAAYEGATRATPVRVVTSSVVVEAPPAAVWPHVVAFPDLPPPSELMFRAGIAYPVRARIEGAGVGAIRRCEFSTGAFVEPITAWEAPRRLAFDVVGQPPSMEELTPWRGPAPKHVRSAFRAVRGEFLLVPLPGGRTRLEGRTWYTLDLAPVGYWRPQADAIVHAIHLRVLRHIADRATAPPAG